MHPPPTRTPPNTPADTKQSHRRTPFRHTPPHPHDTQPRAEDPDEPAVAPDRSEPDREARLAAKDRAFDPSEAI